MTSRTNQGASGKLRTGSIAAIAGGTLLSLSSMALLPGQARACGCLAPPDPSVPVVQAGERILFVEDNGQVTAHIQVQYAGNKADNPKGFGWLVPLPSVPKNSAGQDGIDLGVDELFNQLTSTTQPKYRLTRVYDQCGSTKRDFTGGAQNGPTAAPAGMGADDGGPLVVQNSVGPYEFAVLKADSKDAMFAWLKDNGYFVPAGTDGAVGPYIRPGAFFLALKLLPGQTLGDLQPVVLRYKSDLPMIPIVLTSVGANPHMGIQVWMLGAGRAIPRNYYHTVINDSQIDWFTAGQNYNDVIIKAVGEATGKHSFVTEYAGTSGIMRSVLDAPGRFDVISQLEVTTDPVKFVQLLLQSGFAQRNTSSGPGPIAFQPTLSSQVTAILALAIPEPKALIAQGIKLSDYYQRLDFFLNQDRVANPGNYTDIADALKNFDPAKVSQDLQDRVVMPTLAAGKLFTDFSYLTRLYTTLSPEDMNKDPVFSYNPSLPDYSNIHDATLTFHCNSAFFGDGQYGSATLQTASGWRIDYSAADANNSKFQPQNLPYSQRIETLSEVGNPTVVVDNTDTIKSVLGSSSGCAATGPYHGQTPAAAALLLLGGFGMLLMRRRREPVSR